MGGSDALQWRDGGSKFGGHQDAAAPGCTLPAIYLYITIYWLSMRRHACANKATTAAAAGPEQHGQPRDGKS